MRPLTAGSRYIDWTVNDTSSPATRLPQVLIIGAGFGGLSAAKALANAPVEITLIDRSNHHLFQPLLYQVATAGLSPADIAQPVRGILSGQKNLRVILDEVTSIDPAARRVITPDLSFTYDYLVVAAGARHAYFGHDAWEANAPGLKTLEDATEIRRRVLLAFEVGEKAVTEDERRCALTFVVVGGGPTGVEMAGAIAELARFTLRRDFRRINPAQARILLVEAGPRLLPAFSESSSRIARRDLERLGVEVLTGEAVTALDENSLRIGDRVVPCRTVVWAAGNKASPLAAMLGAETDRAGRVRANRNLTVGPHENIFAIGDMAATTFSGGKPVPGVSPAAMQAGRHAARNILRAMEGQPLADWEYFDKGSMATIGRNAAVCEVGPLRFGGFPAWLAWAFVHLYFLIGFRNRFFVFLHWAWAYFTYAKGARLISRPDGSRGLIPDLSKSGPRPEFPPQTAPEAIRRS